MVRRTLPGAEVDPSACPICGGGNDCVKALARSGPCWCRNETFSFELLAKAGTGKACICERCLRKHTHERDADYVAFPLEGSPQ
ncbi:MAG: cysteine-rich CWC family protein [Gammaproteobacteria bacterium]|nr:cysteine-rich CWC family protein [Gammaproteobacteria bacterium]